MYWKEIRDETRRWDSLVALLRQANEEAQEVIEELRALLDEARERVETLQDELDDLRCQLVEDE